MARTSLDTMVLTRGGFAHVLMRYPEIHDSIKQIGIARRKDAQAAITALDRHEREMKQKQERQEAELRERERERSEQRKVAPSPEQPKLHVHGAAHKRLKMGIKQVRDMNQVVKQFGGALKFGHEGAKPCQHARAERTAPAAEEGEGATPANTGGFAKSRRRSSISALLGRRCGDSATPVQTHAPRDDKDVGTRGHSADSTAEAPPSECGAIRPPLIRNGSRSEGLGKKSAVCVRDGAHGVNARRPSAAPCRRGSSISAMGEVRERRRSIIGGALGLGAIANEQQDLHAEPYCDDY